MTRKLNYEFVKGEFEKRGCELLEKEYINNYTTMMYKCRCGNITKVCWSDFDGGRKRRGEHKCQKCKDNKKIISIKDVNRYFKEQNCELLESEYTNNKTKMKYKCQCGKIAHTTWINFRKGFRCKSCAKNKQFDYQFIKKEFEKSGCELLEKTYNGALKKMNYRCNCGNIAQTTWAAFSRGIRCVKCAGERLSISRRIYFDKTGNERIRDINQRIARRYREMVRRLLRKANSTSYLLGYSGQDLRNHLLKNSHFDIINENHVIDHVYPIVAFINVGIYNPTIINSLDNLQLLTTQENARKSNKYNEQEFKKWLISKGGLRENQSRILHSMVGNKI